ncbi:survival motor neuron protein-like isoform X2 [Sphaerodactylus townsendi]|nr:survival motor neuron protein-like isoform X2 [Sphaerodactylus townsendi]
MAECRGEVVYQSQGPRIADCAAFDDQALIHSYDYAVHSFKETLGNGRNPLECRMNNESESEEEEEEEQEEEVEEEYKDEEEGRQWQIGDACLAVWSVDGLLYPACITSMDQEEGCCVVRFDGYGNEEEQQLTALLPPDWRPPKDENAVREWGRGDPCQAVWSGDGLLYPATIQEVDAETGMCWVEFNHYRNQEWQALADLWPPVERELSTQEVLSDVLRFPEGRSDESKGQANSRIPQPQKDQKPPPPHSCNDEEFLLSMLVAWHLSGYHTGYYVGLRQGQKEMAVLAPKKRPAPHPRVSEHR